MHPRYHESLTIALRAVEAAMHATEQLSRLTTSWNKHDDTSVTIADLVAQLVLESTIATAFPTEPWCAEEEYAASPPAAVADACTTARALGHIVDPAAHDQYRVELDATLPEPCWLIDGIDGTRGFLAGDQYQVVLARLERSTPQLVVLGCPRLTLTPPHGRVLRQPLHLFAIRGQGAYALGTGSDIPVRLTTTPPGSDRLRRCDQHHPPASHDQQTLLRLDGNGAGVVHNDLQYVALVVGLADYFIRVPNPSEGPEWVWDHAPGALLLEEAGGSLTDLDGNPLSWSTPCCLERGLVAATNTRVHATVLKRLGRARSTP